MIEYEDVDVDAGQSRAEKKLLKVQAVNQSLKSQFASEKQKIVRTFINTLSVALQLIQTQKIHHFKNIFYIFIHYFVLFILLEITWVREEPQTQMLDTLLKSFQADMERQISQAKLLANQVREENVSYVREV